MTPSTPLTFALVVRDPDRSRVVVEVTPLPELRAAVAENLRRLGD